MFFLIRRTLFGDYLVMDPVCHPDLGRPGGHRAARAAGHLAGVGRRRTGAWIDDFTRVGVTTLVVVTVLAVLAWGLDYVAGLMGAK